MSDLDVVIVNFRTPDLTRRCVASLVEHGIADASRIIIVDNNSGDGSLELLARELPRCVVIASPHNAGYGAGVNLGVSRARSRFVLVLNPDTYFVENRVAEIFRIFDVEPAIAIIGLNLINPDGSSQHSARRFYSFLDILVRRSRLGTLPVFERRVARHLMRDTPRAADYFEADWVMGTGFVIRRRVFDELGGLDDGFFLYMEDVDLCARTWAAGYRVVCAPSVRLVHDHQRASAALWTTAARIHLRSLARFWRKHRIPLIATPDRDIARR